MVGVKADQDDGEAPDYVGSPRSADSAWLRAASLVGLEIAGRYRVERVIGRGGMAVVYAGEHLKLRRVVAIKVLDAIWATDADATERFLNEARTANALSHPNIVSVFDLDVLPDGRPYLVMPMVAGVDLTVLLAREGRLTPHRVASLLAGVASALDLIHGKGLLHRDVKTENLMHVVNEDGSESALLLDFGIASASWSQSGQATGTWSGTPEFMPPEAFVGEALDLRADIYALATVAFELISGALPFANARVDQIILDKRQAVARRLSEAGAQRFDEALERVIARGLARLPEHRPASAGEFVAALEAVAAPLPREAMPFRTGEPGPSRARTLFQVGGAIDAGEGPGDSDLAQRDQSLHAEPAAEALERPPLQSGVRTTAEGAQRARALAADPWLYKWNMPGLTQTGVAGQSARKSSQGHSSKPPRNRSARPGSWYRRVPLRERTLLVAVALVALGLLFVQRLAPPRATSVRNDWSAAARSATRGGPAVQVRNEPLARPELVKELAEPAPHRAVVTAAGRGDTRAAEQMTLAARALADRNPRLALQRAEEAIRVDPHYAPAWRGKGMLLDSLGRTREAADAYREYLRLEPAGDESSSIRKRLWQLSPR